MAESCILIPNKRGTNTESQLYKDLLDLTGNNRQATNFLWALSQNSALMESLGLNSRQEPSVEDFLNKLGRVESILDSDSFAKFVTKNEGYDEVLFDTYTEAASNLADTKLSYPDLVGLIQEVEGKYKISMLPNTPENRELEARQTALKNLNNRLINYTERLGFAVKEVANLETPGMFSPLNAEENANSLKTAIRIAKSQEGQEALPEEFSHLLVAGFRRNPFMQRLLTVLHNDGVVEEILGDDFDAYNDKYNGDRDLLADEAAARIIAQNLVDRSGLSASISYISDKVLDKIKQNLSLGEESDIDALVRQATEEAQNIVNSFENDETFVEWFDPEALGSASTMYHLQAEGRNLERITKDAHDKLAKRVKLLSLSTKDGKIQRGDAQAFAALKSNITRKKYAAGCMGFLNYVLRDCNQLYESLEDLRDSTRENPNLTDPQLKRAFRTLRSIESAIGAYEDTIEELTALKSNPDVMSELDEADAEEIATLASEVEGVINGLKTIYKDMRMNSLLKFYQRYWGQDKVLKAANGTEKTLSLQDILESNTGDMSGFVRLIGSMSDVADPLLQLVDMTYKDAANTRDAKIFELQQRLGILQSTYTKAAGTRDTSWMYEKDENGVPTGMLISDRDFQKYYKERGEFIKELKEKGFDNVKIAAKLQVWDNQHTEQVDCGFGRKEKMPKKSLYPSNSLVSLTDAQRAYYNEYINIKKELDRLIPNRNAHLYRAVQKKVSIRDSALHGNSFKNIWKAFKNKYVTTSEDDTEYGETVLDDKGRHVILDFEGKEVKKIPVYYTTWIEDKKMLDTNATDVLLSYGAMAYNYTAMNNIADVLEITNSLMQDREIKQTSGIRKLYERFRLTKDDVVQKDYTTPGANSQLAKKLRNYLDSNIYDRRKERETLSIGNQEINVSKIGDALKSYNSVVGLGFNLFSGTTNASMGIAQMMIQATGGQFFGFKNLAHAHALYTKNLGPSFAEGYADNKKNIMSLLVQKFDALDEYYSSLDDSAYNSGLFKKIVGKPNPMVFNSMGEHYLHIVPMFAILDRKQLKLNGENVVMHTAFTTYTDANGITTLTFKDGTTDLEGNTLMTESLMKELSGLQSLDRKSLSEKQSERLQELSEINDRTKQLLFRTKLEIQSANNKMHGAFNSTDKGDIHRNVLGRLVMNFRQWMPSFYMDRFKSRRYKLATDTEEEGFYVTTAKFLFGTLKDLFTAKGNILKHFSELSDMEKSNLKKAGVEVAMLYLIGWILNGFLGMGGLGGPDKDDPWLANMLKYNLYRLKMELGAAAPTSAAFFDNVTTLIQSPIPAVENIDRLIKLLSVNTMFDTIETGRYAGWNRWLRNAYFAVPTARNIGRFFDLTTGDVSMFAPYLKGNSGK